MSDTATKLREAAKSKAMWVTAAINVVLLGKSKAFDQKW